MTLVSAGQAPLFFYRAQSRTVDNWAADDLPLGVVSGVTFEGARKIRFEPGDALVLTTDGFFEWANAAGEQFGIERLEAFVAAHAHETPSEFISALHAAVVAHAAGQKQPDDLTVVIVKRRQQPAAVGAHGSEAPGHPQHRSLN
jgi:serine phosphatase RsbU (regulator of sigma subunit)